MSQLKKLREIVSALNEAEIATISTYIGCFMETGKIAASKGRRLFEVLISKEAKNMSEEEIELSVYKTPNPKAFQLLVLRLRDKVLEGMVIDVNTDREDYPEATKIVVKCRQRITQAQFFIKKGKQTIAEWLIKRTITVCKKHELYDELLLAMKFLIRQKSIHEGEKGLDELLEEYNKYDFCKKAVFKADIYYHKVGCRAEYHAEPKIQIEWLKQILDEIGEEYALTRSVQHAYFFRYIETQYYQLLNDYKSARRSLLELLRLISRGSVMNTPDAIFGLLVNLANNDLYINRFERACKTLNEAEEKFKTKFNNDQTLELMFYAKFYGGEYETAINTIFRLFPELKPTSDFRKGKRNFLIACAYFMKGDFTTAVRYLNILNPIEADKEGWNVGVKLMLILTLIELKEYDEATPKIENMRRQLTPDNVMNHRAKIISQVLQTLAYSGYDFKIAYQKEKSALEMLEEISGPLAWKIKSYEMVIFHQWFFAKAIRQPFVQQIHSHQIDPAGTLKTEQRV